MEYAIIVTTQVLENYAAHDMEWDGKSAHWKCKGGRSEWAFCIEADSHREAESMGFQASFQHADVETKDSLGFIEFITEVKAISIEEATRRSNISEDDFENYNDRITEGPKSLLTLRAKKAEDFRESLGFGQLAHGGRT